MNAPPQQPCAPSAPLRGVGRAVSLLLALGLLAQGAVLLTHTHLASASVPAVADAWQDAPPVDRDVPADPDVAACEVCAVLSQCRATGIAAPLGAIAAPALVAHDIAIDSAAAPRESARTGPGPRSPPSVLV